MYYSTITSSPLSIHNAFETKNLLNSIVGECYGIPFYSLVFQANSNQYPLHNSLHSIRGGGGGNEFLDRSEFRISGMEEYGLISAFLLAIAIDLIGNTEKTWPSPPDDTKSTKLFTRFNFDVLCTYIFLLLSTGCVMLALYSTVVFSLLGLYSKTCLGLNLDDSYDQFTKATSMVRIRGINSFLASLGSLILSFLLSLVLNNDTNFYAIFTILVIISAYVLNDTLKILDLAVKIVYNNVVPDSNMR